MATFQTEQSWGDLTQWHRAPELNVNLEDGDRSEITEIAWHRKDGSEGSISFQDGQRSFLGYYRKPNEGPIAYRGTRSA